MRSIEWKDGDIVVIDQTVLPGRLDYLTLRLTDEVAEAIRSLRVRGAPALGIAGAMGVAQAAVRPHTSSAKTVLERAEQAGTQLAATRPTAVNLAWGIRRVLAKGHAIPPTAGALRIAQAMVDEALAIQAEDEEACTAMAKLALEFFEPKGVVLTHCNTGFLCTGGNGTALGAIRLAHDEGLGIVVVATETRPLLQGARLTAWELGHLGIPHALVVDGAAPGLIARKEVSLVIVGADRVAANGDVANKVGTYPLALAASAAGIPFVVVAPTSTVDLSVPDGRAIPVEERDASEVTSILGARAAPAGTQAINPAFDVTPASLITAIVTEKGVARPPFAPALRDLGNGSRRAAARTASVKPKPARSVRSKPARSPKAVSKKQARSVKTVSRRPPKRVKAVSKKKSPAKQKSTPRRVKAAKRARRR
ncbi:MAG TPA: S-methyl-5-thioribose-1-phosphate isomerase [Actinomycetota bacterium]|nr:S-methyl-5-thioribose-1-phosphate isomerase [Actinomycetota bacterium]